MPDFRGLCARMADELDYYRQLLMDDRREVHALATEARAALAEPEPEGPPMFKPDEVHPFVVRHYTDDQRPSIKGNGFDGLEVGEDRQEAEEFIAWINARLFPSRSN